MKIAQFLTPITGTPFDSVKLLIKLSDLQVNLQILFKPGLPSLSFPPLLPCVQAMFPVPNATLIGVAISGGVMRHGAGYRSVPGDPREEASSAGTGTGDVLDGRVEGGRWYKVSIEQFSQVYSNPLA